MFEKAKWIWSADAAGADCFAEFLAEADIKSEAPVIFRVSADSDYALYINGVYAASGQYGDFPHYKIYDEVDVTRFLAPGKNRFAIVAWYYGASSLNYSVGKPGVIFEAEQNGAILLCSGAGIASRKSRRYIGGRCERITSQLGFNYRLDLRESDEWTARAPDESFAPAVLCGGMPERLLPRPIKKLRIGDVIAGAAVKEGRFCYPETAADDGERMQKALFLPRPDQSDGVYRIVDLGRETAGYLYFDLEVPADCAMEIGWGEHLTDGRCRTKIGARNFSVSFILKAGRNRAIIPFRRIGCRYLQAFIHSERVKFGTLGLCPAVYPLEVKEYRSGNPLRDRIYAVCENTLIQCMHEHYEDCPWREQGLYTLDSRNQMLCGYYAFGEFAFPRAALRLIAQSIRPNGLLPICAPSDAPKQIVSFSLFYIIELAEYFRYSGDADTVEFCYETAEKIIDTFIARIDGTGLAPNFEGEQFWNFYEWQPHLDGKEPTAGKRYDTCLNALLSLALTHFAALGSAGAEKAMQVKERLNKAIREKLFDREAGLLRLYLGQREKQFSVLANALGYLCGAIAREDAGAMLEMILENRARTGVAEIIPTSLSMDTFRYEALLQADRERYAAPILEEIDRVYGAMLARGATSFWETKNGEADFKGAGSLCHGWSAMPIYYYETLFSNGN